MAETQATMALIVAANGFACLLGLFATAVVARRFERPFIGISIAVITGGLVFVATYAATAFFISQKIMTA